jgi:hypothetical protein
MHANPVRKLGKVCEMWRSGQFEGYGLEPVHNSDKKLRALQAAEKLNRKQLCNKGTALAGP